MPASVFTGIPKGYSAEEAATLPCAALTAWRGLMVEARIKPGDVILAGHRWRVDLFCLQFAKAAGCRVISTSSSDEKLEKLRALGADETINYKTTPEWSQEALKLTAGRGVDVVVEIGGAGTPQSINAVRVGEHISLIGVLAGFGGTCPRHSAFGKNAALKGITVGSRAQQRDMIAAIDASGIKPVIDRTFPLAELAEAFRHQESQKHFGKICVAL